MTVRIEKSFGAPSTTIRGVGRMQREHVEASKAQMKDNALDKRYRLSRPEATRGEEIL